MINNLKHIKHIGTSVLMVSIFVLSIFMTSCEFDLPEANSIPDATPPSADFGSTVGDDYFIYKFANFSYSATDYAWDFGDGATATTKDADHVYAESATDVEGTPYTVTLTASDKLGVTSTTSQVIMVLKPEIPPSLDPDVLNGDFSAGADNWKITNEGNTYPFNTSSDGDPLNYDGTPSGGTKTPGAKYTGGTSALPRTSSTRNGYQALTVTPGATYILEYSYAIKTDKTDIEGGDRVIVEILDGWFDHEDDVVASTAAPLGQGIGLEALGKGDFTISKTEFIANDSGQISVWIYAITKDELYVDNVKVYPIEK